MTVSYTHLDVYKRQDDLLVIERNCPALEGDIVVALDEDNQNTLKRYAGYDEDSGYYICLLYTSCGAE